MKSELSLGLAQEMEHKASVGGSEKVLRKLVKDHLKEDPKYYSKLRKFTGKKKGQIHG